MCTLLSVLHKNCFNENVSISGLSPSTLAGETQITRQENVKGWSRVISSLKWIFKDQG